MGGEWARLTLGSAGISVIDCDHRTPKTSSAGLPYVSIPQLARGEVELRGARLISPQDFAEWTRRALPTEGDIVLSRRCNPGETAYVRAGQKFALGQNLVLLRSDNSKIVSAYLKWAVRSPEWWGEIEKYRNPGAVFDSLKCRDIPSFTLTVPPRDIQRDISVLLGSLDDRIELNRRMAETLEAMARALFKSWFVDFDPVHACVEGRATGLPDDLAALFPDSFDEGGLPTGWHQGCLSDVSMLNTENWSRATLPATVEYVDLANTKWGSIEGVQVLPRGEAPSRAQRVLALGDTIVGTVRPGNGSYALISRSGLTGSSGFAVLRPVDASKREILYLAATRRENIESLAQLADGAAYPAVRPEIIAATPFVLPSPAVIEAFSQSTAPLLDAVGLRRRHSETLATLRDTLLPKLISGELRFTDAERQIAAA